MTTIASDVLGRWRRDMASKFPPDRVAWGAAVRGSVEHSLADADKIVWEAGQAARPPHWALVPPERRGGAIRAFDAFSEVNRK